MEALAVSPIVHISVLVYDEKAKFTRPPTLAAQFFETIESHICGHVIVIDVFQINFILTENSQQIDIVSDQMFRDLRVRLTEVKAVDALVPSHAEVSSHAVLTLTCHIVEYEDGIGLRLVRWHH